MRCGKLYERAFQILDPLEGARADSYYGRAFEKRPGDIIFDLGAGEFQQFLVDKVGFW